MHSKCYRPTSFIRIAYFACSLFFLLVTGSPTKAFGSVELKAIFLANAELERMGIHPESYDIEVDDGNQQWDRFMGYMKTSPDIETQQLFEVYDTKLRGKNYWVVYYHPKSIHGGIVKGGGVTLVIEQQTGAPLLVIHGG